MTDECMANDLFTGAVFIDLRKAFDTVDHDLLIKRLHVYGMDPNTINWFQSYLNGRYQQVCVGGHLSDPLLIASGVPQGSIIGPVLFLLFVNDFPLFTENNVDLYANDTTIYTSDPSVLNIEEKLESHSDILRAVKWSKENKMKIHPDKIKSETKNF